MSDEPVDFVALLAKKRAEKGLVPPSVPQPPSTPQPEWDQSVLLPDLGGPDLSDADRALDQFVENIDIIQGYVRWCGKMIPDASNRRTEGIKISCPRPDHPDKDPSAWINTDKQVWFCGGCQEGGDVHDIAAYHFGYPVPQYKEGESFHKLREQMAESFGFHIKQVPGGKVAWLDQPKTQAPPPVAAPPAPQHSEVPESKDAPLPQPEGAEISHMWADDDDDGGEDLVVYPTINWRELVPEDTFLYEYMKATTNDDSPEEYHFWHGLMALGLVCGRNVTLDDTRPVYGNLLLCILGATGTGKTRSRGWLNHVLEKAAPYQEDGTRTTGVKLVPVPSSGEYLVNAFCYEGKDPSNGKTSLGYQSVTGIVDFDEMSALLARANRQGSTMKPTIMQLADASHRVHIGGLQRGDFIAEDPFCTITASTQPKAIRTLLSRNDAGSGFLNRWVFAGGKTKQIEAIGGSRSNIRVDLDASIEELKKVRGWGALTRSVQMDDDAYEAFIKFFRTRIEPAKLKDETDLLKRIDLTFKKLMLLLTINLRKESVPIQVVHAVMELFDYILECYGILNSNIGVTLMQDVMTEIQRHISRHWQKTGRGASARDIAKYTKRKNYSLEQIKKALDVMTALDIIELDKPPTSMGRPTVRYKVVGE